MVLELFVYFFILNLNIHCIVLFWNFPFHLCYSFFDKKSNFLFIAKACQLVNADGELHFQESFSKRTITALLHTKYTKIIKVKLKLYDGGPCLTKRKQDVTWEFWEDDVLKELEMLVTEPLSKKHSNAIGIYKVL